MSGKFKGLKKSKPPNNSAKATASKQENNRHKTKKSMRTGWQKMSDDVKSGLAPPKRKPSK